MGQINLVLLVVSIGLTMAKPISDFYEKNGVWCRKCPPRTHVREDCTSNGSNSSCVPCEKETFNLGWTMSKECQNCAICDISSKLQVLTQCTQTANTICACIPGYLQRNSDAGIYCSPPDSKTNPTRQPPETVTNQTPEIITTTPMDYDLHTNNTKNQTESRNPSGKDGVIIVVSVVVVTVVVVTVVVVTVIVVTVVIMLVIAIIIRNRKKKKYDVVQLHEI